MRTRGQGAGATDQTHSGDTRATLGSHRPEPLGRHSGDTWATQQNSRSGGCSHRPEPLGRHLGNKTEPEFRGLEPPTRATRETLGSHSGKKIGARGPGAGATNQSHSGATREPLGRQIRPRSRNNPYPRLFGRSITLLLRGKTLGAEPPGTLHESVAVRKKAKSPSFVARSPGARTRF